MKKDITPTSAQLADAHAASRLSIPLDDALRSPALARCLEITAEVLVADPSVVNDDHYQGMRSVKRRARNPPEGSPVRDVKRAAAGDEDD